MTNILYVTASARGDSSVTRSLAGALADGIARARGGSVTTRNLTNAVPLLTEEVGNNLAAPKGTSDAAGVLATSDELIAELLAADTVVIGCPVYNFGPPAALKAWADLVARMGHTFQIGETGPAPMVEDRPTYVVTASGYLPIGSEIDFCTRWLVTFLGFLGIQSVEVIAAGGMMIDPEGAMKGAQERIAEIVRQTEGPDRSAVART